MITDDLFGKEAVRLAEQLEGLARGHGGALSLFRNARQSPVVATIVYATGARVVTFRGSGKNKLEALRDLRMNYLHGKPS